MNIKLIKKYLLLLLIPGIILSLFSPAFVSRAEGSPITITVNVYSAQAHYSDYFSSYVKGMGYGKNSKDKYVVDEASRYYANVLAGKKDVKTDLSSASWKWVKQVDESSSDSMAAVTVNSDMLKSGTYKLYWGKGVTTSATYGMEYKLSGETKGNGSSYSFTFSDPSDVRLAIESQGCVLGGINFNSELGWDNVDWFKNNNNYQSGDIQDGAKYSSSGLTFNQNSNSSRLYINNIEGTAASSCTVNVYISATGLDINVSSYNDQLPTPDEDATYYETAEANDNGFAYNYSVGTADYGENEVSSATWVQIGVLVNNFIDEINIITWFYYGVCFLTCVLMIVINIVKVAGCPNNPMMKTHLYMDLGVSVLCLALLGASVILTRLFILTCLG